MMLNKIRQSCQEQSPRESCGFVYGRKCENGFDVSEIHLVPNIAADPNVHFKMDPQSVIQALKRSENNDHVRKEELIGLFHSHPETLPIPSLEDKSTLWQTLPTYWILSLVPGIANPLCIYEMPFSRKSDSGDSGERLCWIKWY